jgi:hypothetical protein
MSRRGFWLGLVVGMIVMGLLAGTAMFAFVRFRGSAEGIYGLRGRQFGISPRGGFYPGMPGRWHGFGAMLCGPVLLIAGALVLAAVLGRHWHHHHHDGAASCCGGQPSPVDKAVRVESAPSAEAEQSEAKDQVPGSTAE